MHWGSREQEHLNLKKVAPHSFFYNLTKFFQQLCNSICSVFCLSLYPLFFLSLLETFLLNAASHCSPLIFPLCLQSFPNFPLLYLLVNLSTTAKAPWPREEHKGFFHLGKHGKGYFNDLRFNIYFKVIPTVNTIGETAA